MSDYEHERYWLLHELRRIRAAVRVGGIAPVTGRSERRAIQKEMVKLRALTTQPSNHKATK